MKEFKFISTVRIADDVSKKYPNYEINGFTPRTLAKRLVSGNSKRSTLNDFGFQYTTNSAVSVKKLFLIQKVIIFGDEIENIEVFFDKKFADEYALVYSKKLYKGVFCFDDCKSFEEINNLAIENQDKLEYMIKVSEIDISYKELYL